MKRTINDSKFFCILLLVLTLDCMISIQETALGATDTIDNNRIKYISTLLSEKPTGFGSPISDRSLWQKLARIDSFRQVITDAERLLQQPVPEQSDDLYLDFSRTGNRTRWQRVSGIRRGRIHTLALAECLENKGRFVPAFEEITEIICSERTWVMPAHDRNLANFNRTSTDIDLGSSTFAWSLATADYLLADKLRPEIHQTIYNNIDKRIFEPYQDMITGKRPKNWWMTTTNNWNAVCLAGVTGAALAIIDRPEQRALYIAAAEHYSKNFLEGFTDDGYCSEGLGYWNYGYGYYIMLCEMIYQATDGKIDLLENKKARQAATFGANIEINNGVYPAFADCSISAEPSSRLMYFISRRLGMGLCSWEQIDPVSASGALYQSLMYSLPNSASRTPLSRDSSPGPGMRSWFDKAGILISRPGSNSSSELAVALKGGHNDEHHNHNDVGSFVVVLDDKPLLIDPGSEVYTARTFSSRRYESNVLNSFGHPVPVVAGKLQQTGGKARARIIKHNFTGSTDTLILDISSAYNVPELLKLERRFVYSRIGKGSLTVTDEVTFSRPCTFGTALITFDNCAVRHPVEKQSSSGTLIVYDSKKALNVDINITGSDFEIKSETINEDVSARKKPTRIGINLTEPVKNALVSMTITPNEQIKK
ncbi:MAG: heparinase II/III family protein [Sedimentisphaerales bacterium]|nr:heparinase II/III family protein [Sedimentisphaerales bacterium]